jgi:hypothetical protein
MLPLAAAVPTEERQKFLFRSIPAYIEATWST